jgi:pyruvate dehydrogenase E1 component beta subunit
MVGALNRSLRDAMEADDKVLVFGEDVGELGGVFRVTDGLTKTFGVDRCFNTPLAEAGIVGVAIGLAMRGYRPVVEIQFDGFSYPAFEQIISHLAKYPNRTRGRVRLPIVVRIPSFGGIGAIEHHCESPESYFVATAGLVVVSPATSADAYSMLREAIDLDDPVVFLEPKRRYWSDDGAHLPVSTEPMRQAVVRRSGTDATIVAYGPSVGIALEAAEIAEGEGRSLEVVDLRCLAPPDIATVVASVERTGRCVIVHEAQRTMGLGAELAASVQEHAFYHLESPVLRATGFDTPYPPPELEQYWLPDPERVLDMVDEAFTY